LILVRAGSKNLREYISLSLIVALSAASLLLTAPGALVQAQSSSDIQEACDAASNIRKLTTFMSACTDKMETGDMSVVGDCVTVIS